MDSKHSKIANVKQHTPLAFSYQSGFLREYGTSVSIGPALVGRPTFVPGILSLVTLQACFALKVVTLKGSSICSAGGWLLTKIVTWMEELYFVYVQPQYSLD